MRGPDTSMYCVIAHGVSPNSIFPSCLLRTDTFYTPGGECRLLYLKLHSNLDENVLSQERVPSIHPRASFPQCAVLTVVTTGGPLTCLPACSMLAFKPLGPPRVGLVHIESKIENPSQRCNG